MTLSTWWIFFCASLLISVAPGPNMLHVMTQGMREGVNRALYTIAGCMVGIVTLLSISSMGMSALIAAMPELLTAIKIAGALYLIWLGIKAWRDDSAPLDLVADPTAIAGRPAGELFRNGFLVSVSNPKALLAAAAFFPQFINAAHPKLPQFAILLVTAIVIETCICLTYATGGRTLARYLRRATWHRALNKASGALFVFFGLSLLAWRQR